MRRTPGWTTLAAIALELAGLALLVRATSRVGQGFGAAPQTPVPPTAPTPQPAPEPAAPASVPEPMEFLAQDAGEGARYYRASDGSLHLFAGFYDEGRVRLADDDRRRFAGVLVEGKADLLEIATNTWSELFLRTTPGGGMLLELRGGPYDARVLTCEAITE